MAVGISTRPLQIEGGQRQFEEDEPFELYSLGLIYDTFHVLANTQHKQPIFAFKRLDDCWVCFDLVLDFIVGIGRRARC